jgi:hypothetical protein
MLLTIIHFLAGIFTYQRISEDSGMFMLDQKMFIEYYALRVIDRAVRDREAHTK